MFQTKEQDKTPEEQLSDMELDNLPKKEFRVMTVKMIQELGKRMDAQREKLQEVLNKELENIESNQTELKNTITEMKNTLEGINSRINEAEEWVSQLEDRVVEIIAMEQNKEKRMRASLVAQWLRVCLPMQGTRVRALVWEDPTCHGATEPVSHDY